MEGVEILDENFDSDTNPVAASFCDLPVFIALSILSFGLYPIWWVYKVWDFYKQREALDIMPVWRALFTILWIYPLFEKIKEEGFKIGLQTNYLSGIFVLGVLVCNISSQLPGLYSMISLFAFVFFIQPVALFNSILDEDHQIVRINKDNLTQRRLIAIFMGLGL